MVDEIKLPVEWVVDENTPASYATHIIVQHTNHEFIISFFETKPPLLFGDAEEQRQQAEALGSIKAHCVSQITVNAERMPEFMQALEKNYQQFIEHRSNTEV